MNPSHMAAFAAELIKLVPGGEEARDKPVHVVQGHFRLLRDELIEGVLPPGDFHEDLPVVFLPARMPGESPSAEAEPEAFAKEEVVVIEHLGDHPGGAVDLRPAQLSQHVRQGGFLADFHRDTEAGLCADAIG